VKPKNPLTVTYLCFAFDISYASFKRRKNEAFVTKRHVPVYNPRRMFIDHCFAVWIDKHPTKKNDCNAKKVRSDLVQLHDTVAFYHDVFYCTLKA
jgi:hypothetical protein